MNYPAVIKHFVEINREQWMDRDSLMHLQQTKLEKLLKAASETCSYQHVFDDNGSAPGIHPFPLTSKEEIQRCPDSFIRKGLSKDSLTVLRTSGSTGMPLSVYLDGHAMDCRIALRRVLESACGLSPFDSYLEITVRDIRSNPILSRLGLFKRRSLSIYDSADKNFSLLRSSGADVVGLYPSAVVIMAKMNDTHGRPVRLKSVFCTAEKLIPEWKKTIEDSFSCPVFNQYGLTETGYVAFECPEEHKMHVMAGSHLVEIVDSKGMPKKSGKGEMVITHLHNRAMPLLRYRTGDIASWGKDCPCGRGLPTLGSIDGKTINLITLPSGREISTQSFYGMHHIPGILSYQTIHEKEDLFVFRFVPAKDFTDETLKAVTDKIKSACLGEDVSVEFEIVDKIRRGRTGKADVVISKVGDKRC